MAGDVPCARKPTSLLLSWPCRVKTCHRASSPHGIHPRGHRRTAAPPLAAAMGQSLEEGTGEGQERSAEVSQLLAGWKGSKSGHVPPSPVPNRLASGTLLRHGHAGVKALRGSESSASQAEIIAFLRRALNGRKGGL